MRYLLLPSAGGVKNISDALNDRHYEVIVPTDFKEFLKYYGVAYTIIGAGELTTDGVFAWGYARGKGKRVIALKGVTPCLVSQTITLANLLKEIPTQNLLWSP